MAHIPAVIFLGLFLILGHSTYSAAGLPVEYQLEELEENNMELNQVLTDKDRHLESVQLKNEILEGLVIKMAVEAKQQTTVGPILNLPEREQEERATNVRFLEIPADRETLFSEELRTTTTPVPIRYLNNYEENLSGEHLVRTTTARPRLVEIVKAIRKYLFLNSRQDERTRAKSRNVLDESFNFLQDRNVQLNYFHSGEETMNGDVEIAALRQGGNTPVPLLYSSDGLKVVIDSKSKVTQTEPDDTTTKSV